MNSKKIRDIILPNHYAEAIEIGKSTLSSSALVTSGLKIACYSWVSRRKKDYEAYVAIRPGSAPIIIGLVSLESMELTGLDVSREWEQILCICRSPYLDLSKEKDEFFFQVVEKSKR